MRVDKYTKIEGPRFTWDVISIIAENKWHVYHKTHLHTMKVYNTRPTIAVLLLNSDSDLDSREITSLPKIRKVIYMKRHSHHRRK